MPLLTGASVTVSGANTATQFTNVRFPAHTVYVFAKTGTIWLGDSNVSSTPGAERGIAITQGTGQQFAAEYAPDNFEAGDVWFASTNPAATLTMAVIQS